MSTDPFLYSTSSTFSWDNTLCFVITSGLTLLFYCILSINYLCCVTVSLKTLLKIKHFTISSFLWIKSTGSALGSLSATIKMLAGVPISAKAKLGPKNPLSSSWGCWQLSVFYRLLFWKPQFLVDYGPSSGAQHMAPNTRRLATSQLASSKQGREGSQSGHYNLVYCNHVLVIMRIRHFCCTLGWKEVRGHFRA